MKIVFLVLMTAGFFVIALNWSIPFRYYLLHRRTKSMSLMPVIGGVMASVGMALGGGDGLSRWWWLPLVIDPGAALLIVMISLKLMKAAGRE